MSEAGGNPYQGEDGRPTLLPSVVAWVDVLGFQHLIAGNRAPATEEEALAKFWAALSASMGELKPLDSWVWPGPASWQVKTFTDNYVIGVPLVPDRPFRGLVELLLAANRVARFQLKLALEGFLVRGAVAVGLVCMAEHLAFGSGLLEAYRAEGRDARDPRIILTPSATAVLDVGLRVRQLTFGEDAPHAPFWQDVDDRVFINYLSSVVEFEHDMGYPDTETFIRHGEVVSQKLAELVADPPKAQKWAWTARYHNEFLRHRTDFPDESRIDADRLAGALREYRLRS